MDLTLYIGNKNYSSWSLRPYLALKAAKLSFREEKILLRKPDTKDNLLAISSAGRVPILRDGDLVIWESLAICEYAAELAPEAQLWPLDKKAKAMARAISTEMHNGFPLIRQYLPMDITNDRHHQSRVRDAYPDVQRIQELWESCLIKSGGPFLFGHFTIADAMYAPVVSRFHTYRVPVTPILKQYIETVFLFPAFVEWHNDALHEERNFIFPVLEEKLAQ